MDRGLQNEKDIVRFPLYSDDYNRVVPAGTRGFTETMGFGGSSYVQPVQDSVLINCWAEKDAQGNWTVVKRPGIATATGDISTSGLGGTATQYKVHNLTEMQAIPGMFVAVVTTSIAGVPHLVYWQGDGSGGVTDIGALTGASIALEIGLSFLSEISVTGTPGVAFNYQTASGSGAISLYSMMVASGSTFIWTGATVNQITDVDFPTNQTPSITAVGAFVQLNEHIFIMGRNGKVYNSDIGSISSWNSRGVQPASIEPDGGVGLAKYKQHIVAFGTDTMEFFEDAGLAPPGGPLQRTEQAFIKIGCVSGSAIINLADTIYWVASGNSHTKGVYKLDQYTPSKVSGPAQMPWLTYPSTHLRLASVMLGGCQHICFNNLKNPSGNTLITPTLIAGATFTPVGGQTESYPPTLYDVTPSMLCYNITHGSWWWWSDENIPGVNIFSATTYTTDSGASGQTVIIKRSPSINPTSGRSDYVIFAIQDPHITSTGTLSDIPMAYTDNNGTGTQKAVCMIIQMPPIEFEVEARKAVNKIKLIADASVKYSDDVSTGNQLYLLVNRFDGQGTILSRGLLIPTTNHRYVFNNWGMTRKLYMAFVSKTAMAFRGKCVEMHVTQSTG